MQSPRAPWPWRALRAVLLALAAVVIVDRGMGLAAADGVGRAARAVAAADAPRGAHPRRARRASRWCCSWCRRCCCSRSSCWRCGSSTWAHAALGVAIIVLAKLLGTALVGRLFIITEPQLMQFRLVRARAGLVARDQAARAVRRCERSAGWQALQRVRAARCRCGCAGARAQAR